MTETTPPGPPSSQKHSLGPACFGLALMAMFWAFAQFSLGLDYAGLGPGYEVTNVARHLAVSGDFSDPFSIPTGPTAHVAPVYTALVAVVLRTLGFSQPAVLVLVFLNAVLLAIGAALLPAVSRRVFGHPGPGIAGGILLVASGRLMPQHEVALSALLLSSTALLMLSHGRLVSGFAAGASILANPLAVLPVAVLGMGRGKRWFVAAGGLAFLFCLPWIVRNYLALGSPYFIRDNFGLELFLSNQDQAGPEMRTNAAFWSGHPTYNAAEAAQVARQGEGPYNQAKLRIARDWILQHPKRFLYLSVARAFRYWFPSPESGGWAAYGCQLANVLAIPGIWFARRNSTARLLALAALSYSLPYTVIKADLKYVYPMLWISSLLAGYTIHRVILHKGTGS